MKINKVQSRGRVSEGSTLPETLVSLSCSFGNSCIALFLPPFALPYLPLSCLTSPLPSLTSLCPALPPHVLPYLSLVLPYIPLSWFTSPCPVLPPPCTVLPPFVLVYLPLPCLTSPRAALPSLFVPYLPMSFFTEKGWEREGGTVKRGGTGRVHCKDCLLYTSPSPRDAMASRMPSSA